VAGAVSEAIACGTPVISTRTGEPGLYVTEEVGLLVEAGNVDELAQAVTLMSRTHARYDPARLHEYMRQLYGFEAVTEQLLDVYREILGRRRHRPETLP
jgi:glycosyltransferase involved in cell wall biosynthesis